MCRGVLDRLEMFAAIEADVHWTWDELSDCQYIKR